MQQPLTPLRRRPKKLTETPDVFRAGAGSPVNAELNFDRGHGDVDLPAGGQGVLATAQAATQKNMSELLEDSVPDPTVMEMAHVIARRLSIRRRPRHNRTERGGDSLISLPYSYRSDDIDLDRTIDAMAEHRVLEDTDVIVRERIGPRRAAVLIIDLSGSMRGEKVRIAAATVAALAANMSGPGQQLAVVAFWSDAAVVSGLDEPHTSTTLIDILLRIPARGLTNVGFGLSVAHAELVRAAARRQAAILLTDSVHNAGPDPRHMAKRFKELHVLLETDGEHDLPLGRDLARLGNGTLSAIRTHRDVAPALNRILSV